MRRLTILAGALGAVVLLTSAATAQAPAAPEPQTPTTVGPAFVDASGNAICDNCTGTPQRKGQSVRGGRGGAGPGSGAGNQGVGPRDGSGYGRAGGRGTGTCNGTGPRGRGRSGR